jgi:hypothetical protein
MPSANRSWPAAAKVQIGMICARSADRDLYPTPTNIRQGSLIVRANYNMPAVTLRDREERQPSLLWPT